jgi:hypothetical protein
MTTVHDATIGAVRMMPLDNGTAPLDPTVLLGVITPAVPSLEDRLRAAQGEGLEANLRRALAFADIGGPIELQALAVPDGYRLTNKAAHALTVDAAVKLAIAGEKFNAQGVYIIHARLRPGAETRHPAAQWYVMQEKGSTTDRDIAQRLVLGVDLDVERVKGISATDAEMALSVAVAGKVWGYLSASIGADSLAYLHSGNGRQIWIALAALANTDAIKLLLASTLAGLASMFNTEDVKVDLTLVDAKRILPAAGTTKRKGDRSWEAERPHRRTAILTPAKVRRLGETDLRELAARVRQDCGEAGRKAMDAALGIKAQSKASSSATSETATDDPFVLANAVDPVDVAERLGVKVGDVVTCPGCGSVDGVKILPHGFKCSHNRCAAKGRGGKTPGFRTNVDLTMEVRGLDDVGAGKLLAEWYGFTPPHDRKTAAGSTPADRGDAWEGSDDADSYVGSVDDGAAPVDPDGVEGEKRAEDTARKPGELPRVERGKDVHRVLEDLDRALSDPETGDARLYQRSGELVIARGVMAEDARRLRIKFAPDAIVLSPLRVASLLPRVTEHVDFGGWHVQETAAEDGTATKTRVWRRDLPTGGLLSSFLSKAYWAHVRPIRGVAVTPIIHLDGSIVADGYDASTQYLVASNVVLPPIPEQPSAEDATAALTALWEPFAQFPFETQAERCSPVALALTLILRPVIRGNVPAIVQTAPQKNCGKSLTAKGACLLATGQIPASNTWPRGDEEQEKMIGAAADAGADVLFFDNVAEGAVIGGAPIDKVLTCDGFNSFRVLGQSTLKRLPWGAVVIFTANRGWIGGDTDRRAAVSTLIRPDVAPEKFRHPDLLDYIGRERPRLLAAAFTLIRAWIQAGKPDAGVRRLDSFEHWGWTVAAMIRWAGGGDVRELVRDIVGTDTDEDEFMLLRGIHAWLAEKGVGDFTVKELVADVFSSPLLTPGHDELRATIESLAASGKGEARKVDLRRLGKRLARMRDVLQGGYRLKQVGTADGGLLRWSVLKIGAHGFNGLHGLIPAQARARRNETLDDTRATQPIEPLQPMQGDVGYPEEWDGEGLS